MEGKLVKTEKQCVLQNEQGIVIATSLEGGKLSKKNCQAIERGYDLDELIREVDTSHLQDYTSDSHELVFDEGFKMGFQKAIEILGDKKFDEEDLKRVFIEGSNWTKDESLEHDATFGQAMSRTIQSLQKTEWDVEIKMECLVSTSYQIIDFSENIPQITSKGDRSCMEERPALDANGCLILKRK